MNNSLFYVQKYSPTNKIIIHKTTIFNNMVKYCDDCGTELKDDDQFCENCGKKQSSKQKNRQIAIIVGLIIIITILALFLLASVKTSCELEIISSSTITTDTDFSVRLTSEGKDIKGKTIHFIFDDGKSTCEFDADTDKHGKASINPALNIGNYSVKCSFNGDDKYSSCEINDKISIEKAEPDYMAYDPFISFSETDKYNKGYVLYSDMHLAHTPEDIGMQMFAESDENNDGKLNDYEYHKFMYLLNNNRAEYGLE